MSGCFISYRRTDSGPWAGRLRDRLVADFPHTTIFFDVDSIELGQDFRTVINSTLDECNVVLVLIGPAWLDPGADGRPRIQDPADVHRIEVATALASDVLVIPVLVGGATMPSTDVLPPDLQALTFRNALVIDHPSFTRDVELLATNLRRIDGFEAEREAPAAVAAAMPAATPVAPPAATPVAPEPTVVRSKKPLLIGLAVLAVAAVVGIVVVVASGGSDKTAAPTTTAPATTAPATTPGPGGAVVLPAASSLYAKPPSRVVAQLQKLGLNVSTGDWCSYTLAVGLVRQITLGGGSNGAVLVGKPSESVDPQAIASLKVGDEVTVWVVTQRGDC